MALDEVDFRVLKQVKVNTEDTAIELKKLAKSQTAFQESMLTVFNRIATSLASIDAEIKALRRDLQPASIDKAPAAGLSRAKP